MHKRYVIQDKLGFFFEGKRGMVFTWTKDRKKAFVFEQEWLADTVRRVVGGEVKPK